MGNPHKSTSEVPDRWQAFVRPFRCTLASWACRPCFSKSTNTVVPCSWASPIFPSTPIHYYNMEVKLWNITRQFAHSSASIKSEAEFLLHICVYWNANRHFFLTCRQSFRSGGKGKDTDFGSPSSGRRRFAGKSPHSAREVVFFTKNLYSRPRILDEAAETKRPQRQDRRKKKWQVQRILHIGQVQETHFLQFMETAISYKPIQTRTI